MYRHKCEPRAVGDVFAKSKLDMPGPTMRCSRFRDHVHHGGQADGCSATPTLPQQQVFTRFFLCRALQRTVTRVAYTLPGPPRTGSVRFALRRQPHAPIGHLCSARMPRSSFPLRATRRTALSASCVNTTPLVPHFQRIEVSFAGAALLPTTPCTMPQIAGPSVSGWHT